MVQQFTRNLSWPGLECSFKTEKGKELCSFRWNADTPGFGYAAPVMMDGVVERIEPGSNGIIFEKKHGSPMLKAEAADALFLFKLNLIKN